jgi:hypothetical protein
MTNPWHNNKNDPLVNAVRDVVQKGMVKREADMNEIGAAMNAGTTERIQGLKALEALHATPMEVQTALGTKDD